LKGKSEKTQKHAKLTPENEALVLKMEKTRNLFGDTQEEFAERMDLAHNSIHLYESLKRHVSTKTYRRFKEIEEIRDIPYKSDEIAEYKKQAQLKIKTINYKNKDEVLAEIEILRHCVKWCFDDDLINFCYLIIALYYFMINKKEEYEAILSLLDKSVFTDEHYYRHSSLMGTIFHKDWWYSDTQNMYLKARYHGKNIGMDVAWLDYRIGYSYTEMGYPHQALYYLEGVDYQYLLSVISYSGIVSYNKFLAVNYAKTGRGDKALELLNNTDRQLVIENKNDNRSFINLKKAFGQVHQILDNKEEALQYYNSALGLYTDKSESYLEAICLKTTLLRGFKIEDISLDELSEAIEIAEKDGFWYDWLNAIYYSLKLDDKASLGYFIHTSIPKMTRYGRPELVIEFRKWLIEHYKTVPSYKSITEQHEEIDKIRVKILKGELIS